MHRNSTFEIDDHAITGSGFTQRSAYPAEFAGNRFVLTNTDTLCIKVYSNNQTGDCFAVGFGQFFGNDWIHVVSEGSAAGDSFWKEYAQVEYNKMLASAPGHALSLYKARSTGRACCMQTRLDQLTLRTCLMQKSPRENGIKLETFREGEWMGPDVDVSGTFPCLCITSVSALTLLFIEN